MIKDFAAKFGGEYDLLEAAEHMPETAEGLNIEGMATWDRQGVAPEKKKGVIIGLRGPLFNGNALLIPLLNPVEYISTPGVAADFGTPIQIPLEGHGIRDIALIGERYYIIGGPSETDGTFVLYSWSGDPDDKTVKKLADLKADGAKPEAVLSMDDGATISVLSDDGDYILSKNDDTKCGDIKDESKRQFRMFDVPLAQ